MREGCFMPNVCERTQIVKFRKIELVQPPPNTQQAVYFKYIITPEPNTNLTNISNIRLSFCPNSSDAIRENFFDRCSWRVTFNDNTTQDSGDGDCFLDNTFPNSQENPANCKGVKFGNLPSGNVTMIELFLLLKHPLPVGSVDIGFKAGNTDSGIWEGVFGPLFQTSRGLKIFCNSFVY